MKLHCYGIILLMLLAPGRLIAQEKAPPVKDETKNVLLVNFGVGVYEDFTLSITGYYERHLKTLAQPKSGQLWFKVGFGAWGGWGVSGNQYLAALSWRPLAGSLHPELSMGIATIVYKSYSQSVNVYPLAGFGLRYQKPAGHFAFRTGFSFPEGVYLGLGYVF